MTSEERIEELLNRANNTISDLPKDFIIDYSAEQGITYLRHALEACGVPPDTGVDGEADETTIGAALVSACDFGLHLNDVVERLCWALENTLIRYDKALYRLRSWGDIKYVADLEEGKV